MIQIIYKLLEINESYNESFNVVKLFNYLLISRENIYFLSNDIFIDKINKFIYEICKLIFLKYTNEQEVIKLSEIMLNKILEISKNKDDLKSYLDYNLQVLVVNTLILCLKLTHIILEKNFHSDLFRKAVLEKITRCLIEVMYT
jgi:hypothetical protein